MDGTLIQKVQNSISQLCRECSKANKSPESVLLAAQNDDDVGVTLSLVKSNNFKTSPVTTLFDLSFPLIIGEKTLENNSEPEYFVESTRVNNVSNLSMMNASNTFGDVFKESSSNNTKSNCSTIGDMAGSPLKLQSIADLSDFTYNAQPSSVSDAPGLTISAPFKIKTALPLAQARTLSSAYAMLYRDFKENNKNLQKEKSKVVPSMLVYCDGTDRKRSAFVSAEAVKDRDENYIGIKTLTVSVKDPEPNNNHLPKLQNKTLNAKRIHCKSSYDIIEASKDDKVQTLYPGTLFVEVEWEKPPMDISLLQRPPHESRTKICASVVSGDIRSAANTFYRELELLKSFVSGLETGVIKWLAEKRDKTVMESLVELIEYLKLGHSVTPMQGNEESNEALSTAVNSLFFEDRKDLDFVDRLWKVLMYSTSCSELVECFQYIFKVLISGELQPFIRSNNNCIFAQLVIDSYTGKLRMPNLAGLYPVELLVEIGLEKLHQDYEFAFLSKELATMSSLRPFLQSNSQTVKQIENLDKLHNMLEMVVMLKLFLSNITNDDLVCISREMLKHYKENPVSPDFRFTFPLPTSSVRNILESCPPCSWKIEDTKLIENVEETMTIVLSTEHPFPHLEGKQEMDFNKTAKDGDNYSPEYYYLKGEERVCILN